MCSHQHFRIFFSYLPIFILVNLSFLRNGNAQIFSLHQYTTDDGLPGATIYSLDQDEDGII